MSKFWTNYKVLIFGVLTSAAVSLQQIATPNPDIKVIAYAIIMAALAAIVSFEKQAQGQIASIIGIVGTTLGTVVPSLFQGQPVSWLQIIGSTIFAILAILNPGQAAENKTPVMAMSLGIPQAVPGGDPNFNKKGSFIVCVALIAINGFTFFFFAADIPLTVRIISAAVTIACGVKIATMESPYISNGLFWGLVILSLVMTFGEMGWAENVRSLKEISNV